MAARGRGAGDTMKAGAVLLALLGVAVTTGAAYPSVTRRVAVRRERAEPRDAQGVRAGADAYTMGHGTDAILFVHGFGSSPATFRFLAQDLAARGFTCRAMRLPGFSERIDAMMGVDDGDWRDAVVAESAALRSNHRRVWLAGHSMGGAVVLDVVLGHAAEVDGLILIAPLIEVSTRRSLGIPSRDLFRVARALLPPDAILRTMFPVDLHARRDGVDELRDTFMPASLYEAMFRVSGRIRASAPAIREPALLVLPGSDKVVSRRASLAFYDGLASSRKRLHHAPRAGHVVPLDYGWPEVAAAIDSFVREEQP